MSVGEKKPTVKRDALYDSIVSKTDLYHRLLP